MIHKLRSECVLCFQRFYKFSDTYWACTITWPNIVVFNITNNRFNWTMYLIYFSLQTAILTILLVPLRLLIITSLLIVAWIFASIGLWGLTMQDLNTKPISGWRRWGIFLLCYLSIHSRHVHLSCWHCIKK